MCRDSKGRYKFSFMEMITSGRDGSTSATGLIGVILSLVCILMSVSIFIFYFMNRQEAENILSLLIQFLLYNSKQNHHDILCSRHIYLKLQYHHS